MYVENILLPQQSPQISNRLVVTQITNGNIESNQRITKNSLHRNQIRMSKDENQNNRKVNQSRQCTMSKRGFIVSLNTDFNINLQVPTHTRTQRS